MKSYRMLLLFSTLALHAYASGVFHEMSSLSIDHVSFANCTFDETISTVTGLWHRAKGTSLTIESAPVISEQSRGKKISVTAKNLSLLQLLDLICMPIDARIHAQGSSIRIEPPAPLSCSASVSILLSEEDKLFFDTSRGVASLPNINMMLWRSGVNTNYIDIGFPVDDGELICAGDAEEVFLTKAIFLLRKRGSRIIHIPDTATNSLSVDHENSK